MDELLTTVVRRPYVFGFLAAYLFLSIRLWGWRRSLLWLVSGYAIAWLSEYSSITNGFPYSEYHYKYENMPGELFIAGVPFFDSLSYPFLIFAGFTTAKYALRRGNSFATMFAGAWLTMTLDVIIDPLTKMGDKWFLGDIYFYSTKGIYFNVPLSNFSGWFLVSLAVIAFNVFAWRIAPKLAMNERCENILYPLFYSSVALFILGITYWIGAWALAAASTAVFAITLVAIYMSRRHMLLSSS
jgi:putative membrane protein